MTACFQQRAHGKLARDTNQCEKPLLVEECLTSAAENEYAMFSCTGEVQFSLSAEITFTF